MVLEGLLPEKTDGVKTDVVSRSVLAYALRVAFADVSHTNRSPP